METEVAHDLCQRWSNLKVKGWSTPIAFKEKLAELQKAAQRVARARGPKSRADIGTGISATLERVIATIEPMRPKIIGVIRSQARDVCQVANRRTKQPNGEFKLFEIDWNDLGQELENLLLNCYDASLFTESDVETSSAFRHIFSFLKIDLDDWVHGLDETAWKNGRPRVCVGVPMPAFATVNNGDRLLQLIKGLERLAGDLPQALSGTHESWIDGSASHAKGKVTGQHTGNQAGKLFVDADTFTVSADGKSHTFKSRSKLLFLLIERISRCRGVKVNFAALREKDSVSDGAVVEDVTIRGAIARLKKTLRSAGMHELANSINTRRIRSQPFVMLDSPRENKPNSN